jgi:NADH-quinone oxidoreductase subunit A
MHSGGSSFNFYFFFSISLSRNPYNKRLIRTIFLSVCLIKKSLDMYFTLLVVVILTAIALVAVALGIARAISPRSYNSQKGEAYECGIPTRGRSWMQFKVGYYLFAILFLMFDVETVFLFPWAVVVQDLGVYGLFSILFFLVILVLGLAYAWKKGALEWK